MISAAKRITKTSVTALLVGPLVRERNLHSLFSLPDWKLYTASDCAEALALMRWTAIPVLICERELPDGNWKTLIDSVCRLPRPPRVLVSSRFTDHAFWGEVIQMGGYAVIASPLEEREMKAQVQVAHRSWHREWQDSPAAFTRMLL